LAPGWWCGASSIGDRARSDLAIGWFFNISCGVGGCYGGASFVALREKYRGDCLFLDWQMFAFIVFFAGFSSSASSGW